jgi:hypothetical protein
MISRCHIHNYIKENNFFPLQFRYYNYLLFINNISFSKANIINVSPLNGMSSNKTRHTTRGFLDVASKILTSSPLFQGSSSSHGRQEVLLGHI